MRFTRQSHSPEFLLLAMLVVAWLGHTTPLAIAQDTVTGAFEGTVTDSSTGAPVSRASVQIVNQQTLQVIPKTTDSRGRFYQGLLAPGLYTIRVSAPGFLTKEVQQRLFITRTGEVVPVPVSLEPAPPTTPTPAPTPTPTITATPTTTGTPTATATPTPTPAAT